jgi:hypothetical protein
VFLNKEQHRRTKRYSAFGVSCSKLEVGVSCLSPSQWGGKSVVHDSEIIWEWLQNINSFPLGNISQSDSDICLPFLSSVTCIRCLSSSWAAWT